MNPDNHVMFSRMIEDYLRTIEDPKQYQREARVLRKLQRFVSEERRRWEEMFTLEAVYDFRRKMRLSRYCVATVARFSEHAFTRDSIPRPLAVTSYQEPLPVTYEDYLVWLKRYRHFCSKRIREARRVLAHFHWHLQRSGRELSGLHIEDIDRFLYGLFTGLSPASCKAYRGVLRMFSLVPLPSTGHHQQGLCRAHSRSPCLCQNPAAPVPAPGRGTEAPWIPQPVFALAHPTIGIRTSGLHAGAASQ